MSATQDAIPQRSFVFVYASSDGHTTNYQHRPARAHTALVNWQRHRQRHRSSRERQTDRATIQDRSRPSGAHEHPVRTLSPVFGALAGSTLPPSVKPLTGRVAEHCVRIMLPELLYSEQAASAWMQAFCEHSIIFHALHCAAAVHADALDGETTRSSSHEWLVHKHIAIHTLNGMLVGLHHSDLTTAIQAVLLLTHNEPWRMVSREDRFRRPFSPHFPSAGWPAVFGNMPVIEPHARALKYLVNRAGGLESINFPGLAPVLALCDLMASSIDAVPPTYACFWDDTCLHSVSALAGLLRLPQDSSPGRGFRMYLSGSLTANSVPVFVQLAIVDTALASCRHRRINESDYRALIFARNAAQHRLLCLDSYSTTFFDLADRQVSKLAEVCRLTALLYSNSVILPIPPQSHWRLQILQSLRTLLQDFEVWSIVDERWQICAWSTSVAALVAQNSSLESSFKALVRETLRARGITEHSAHSDLPDLLQKFLWSPSACSSGFMMLQTMLADDR